MRLELPVAVGALISERPPHRTVDACRPWFTAAENSQTVPKSLKDKGDEIRTFSEVRLEIASKPHCFADVAP